MPKIKRMYAFVAEEEPGEEGVMGMQMGDGAWIPLVGADMTRIEQLIPIADRIAAISNMPYKIIKFRIEEVIERRNPVNPDNN